MRSDVLIYECPDLLTFNDVSETELEKMPDNFFHSLESKSTASDNDCYKFIFERFRELKGLNTFNFKDITNGQKKF